LIAANINPGMYRKSFAFEQWNDFDEELFDRLYNDESQEREFKFKIYGADISPKAVAIAEKNVKQAGVAKYVDLQIKPIALWEEAPENCFIITNPPYGERISSDDMEGLYETIGAKLKHVFKGHAWIIGYKDEYFKKIGLAPSSRTPILNGALECELREYVIFDGDYKSFRKGGGSIKVGDREERPERKGKIKRVSDRQWKEDARRKGMGGKEMRGPKPEKRSALEERYLAKPKGRARREEKPEVVSENPLAKRRNEGALKTILGRTPSLPPAEGPFMRTRRGWKRPIEKGETNNNENK
jgi:putative N6-adenine-specific DNA methylase